jgi:hypothetical protein
MSVPADQLLQDRTQDVKSAGDRQAALDASRTSTAAAREKELAPMEAGVNAQIGELSKVQPPKQTPLPTYEPKPPVDAKEYQQLSMGLIAMAMIGGIASKGNWMGASASLNGALKGYMEGNQQAAEREYKDYQTKFKEAQAKSQAEQKEFEDILQNKRLSINDMLTQVKVAAAKYGRDDVRAEAEQKSIDGIWRRVEAMDATIARITDADQRQRNGLDAAMAKRAEGEFTDGESKLLAAMADKNVSLPAGLRSQKQIKSTLDGLMKEHPDLDANGIAEGLKSGKLKLAAETKAASTAGTQIGKVALASNELDSFGDQVIEASKGIPRGTSLTLNGIMQSSEKQLSDPKLLRLKVKLQALNNAYDQLAARGGTDAAKREHIHELFNSQLSDKAIQELVKSVKEEAAGAREAANRTIAETSNTSIPGAGPAAAAPGAHPPDIQSILDKYPSH